MKSIEEEAKELVAKFIEPTQQWNGDEWKPEIESAKQCAIIHCDLMIEKLQSLHKPEYTTFILRYMDYSTTPITDPVTCDGYELINHYTLLKEAVGKI